MTYCQYMETITRNIETLTAFHAVATYGSFTLAAEKHRTSKAMLSKHVKQLESSLRVQLFHRTTRRLSLTEQGHALFNYSQKIFGLCEEADRRLRDMHQGQSGIIKISAPPSFGESFFNSFIPQITPLLPKVKFEVDLTAEVRDFFSDRIDFAIRIAENHHPDLVARHLGQLLDVVCVSPELYKKLKLKSDPRCLSEQECILNSHDKKWNTWSFRKGTQDIKVEVTGRYASNQYFMARSMCINGLGIARLPYYIVYEDLKSGRLVPIFSEYKIATHQLYLVYLRSEFSTSKHRTTKDEILKWFNHRNEIFFRSS